VGEVGLINVNDVDVAPNLNNATVYIAFSEGHNKKRGHEAWTESQAHPRLLGKAVVLKYTPPFDLCLTIVERGNASYAFWANWSNPRPFMKSHPKII